MPEEVLEAPIEPTISPEVANQPESESTQMVGNESIASQAPQELPEQLAPQSVSVPEPSSSISLAFILSQYLLKAKEAIFNRKKKKLEKILLQASKKNGIANDEVEKLLHVSNATAQRYLGELVKAGKLITNGKKGRALRYYVRV